MNTQQNMEERLWDYIDGTCSPEEKSSMEKLVESNVEWRAKYKELLEVHQLMANHIELDEPSMRFTQNVMENISKYQIAPAAKSYINKRVIWGIGTFFLLSILGFLVYGFFQINWNTTGGSSNLINGINQNLDSFNKVDIGKFFNSTSTTLFMMVNVVLGLVLLDMFLTKKKRQLQEKH
jgi:hypothetical protein